MDISNIIGKKLQKKRLSESDFLCVVNGFLNDEVSETQMTGFLKAITDNNLNNSEIYSLTKAMQNAGGGKTLDLNGLVADKHSTGGVSDSTTLLVVPIVAAAGVKILKMSGKSLGFTGGTADKILCFEGIKNDIPTQKALRILKKTGGCFLTQSDEIAPADKKIYALRDKVGLIASIPLIASSIVSKKLASGGNIIVFDVKVGQGAFIKSLRDAVSLAKIMIDIVKREKKKACAVISSMDEPLGNFIGDCLEVQEAIEILKTAIKPLNTEYRQSSDTKSVKYVSSSFKVINVSTLVSNLKEEEISKNSNGDKNGNNLLSLSKTLAALIIKFAKNIELEDAKKQVEKVLGNGRALTKLKEIIREQGGSLNLFNKKTDYINREIYLDEKGYIKNLDTENLGLITKKIAEKYKDFVGIEILARRGDKISPNAILAKLYFKKDEIEKTKSKKLIKKEIETKQKILNEIIEKYEECFKISPTKTKPKGNVIKKIIY